MADLGVPQYQETRPAFGEGDALTAAGRAIADTATGVAETINTRKVENLRDELEGLSASELASYQQSQLEQGQDQYTIVPELNAEAELLWNDVADLKRKINSGAATGAAKTQLLNKAKLVTSQALRATRNPQVRARMVAEYQQFTAFNPALDVLGMVDQQDSLEGQYAQKQLDLMFDVSYKSKRDGGMGIPPNVVFGSNEWMTQFSYENRQRAQLDTNLAALENFTVSEQVNLREQIPAIDKALGESQKTVDGLIRPQVETGIAVGQAMQRIANNVPQDGDAEMVNNWTISGKEVFQSQMLAQQAELEVLKVKLSAAGNLDEFGQGTLKRIEAQQAYIDRWIQISELMTERPDIIKLGEFENEVRRLQFKDKNPQAEELIFNIRQFGPLLENAETFDLRDALLAEGMGQFSIDNIITTMAKNEVFGSSWARSIGSPDSMLERASYERSISNDAFGANSTDPEGRGQEAMKHLAGSVVQRPNLNVSIMTSDVPPNPHVFSTYLGEASMVEELRMGEHYLRPGTSEQIERLYAEDIIVKQTEALRSKAMEPGQNEAIQALGESLLRYNNQSDILGRKQAFANELGQKYGNVRLQDVIEWDFEDLDKGQVRITVMPNAGELAAVQAGVDPRLSATGFTVGPSARVEQQKLEAAARRLETNLSRILKYEAHVQFLRSNQLKPSYIRTWDQNRYNEIFVIRPRD